MVVLSLHFLTILVILLDCTVVSVHFYSTIPSHEQHQTGCNKFNEPKHMVQEYVAN